MTETEKMTKVERKAQKVKQAQQKVDNIIVDSTAMRRK